MIVPFFSMLNQPGPNRIGLYVFPFLMVALVPAQAVMKTARLKSRSGWADLAPKLSLPESNPLLNRDFFVFGCAE